MGENMNTNAIIFFDLETTGLDPETHTIIQIAACAVDKATYDVLEDFEVKIKFRVDKADPEALEGNSYDEAVWEREAVGATKARAMFMAFIEKYKTVPKIAKGSGRVYYVAQLVGYNSDNFDLPFFRAWSNRLDEYHFSKSKSMQLYESDMAIYNMALDDYMHWRDKPTPVSHPGEPPTKPVMGDRYGPFITINWRSIDLYQLALFNQIIRNVGYEDLKLLTVCRKHGITETQRHDAMDDVRLTAALFPLLVEGVALDNNISQNAPENKAEQMTMNILNNLPKFDTSYEEI